MERRIGIIGTLNLEILLGPIDRVPGPDEQALVDRFHIRHAGSGPSVGLVLAALGVRPALFGTVGDDAAGADLCRRLTAKDLDMRAVSRVARRSTGICLSLADSGGRHCYISHLGAVAATTLPRLQRHWDALRRCRVILLTGYFVLPGLGYRGALTLFKRLRRNGCLVALDTGWDPQQWPAATRGRIARLLEHVDIFLPNRAEACALTRKRDVRTAARALQPLGPRTVFVKRESRGALLATADGIQSHRGFPRKARDTTAAGEAFNAGVLFALTHGLTDAEALAFANATAARFVQTGDQSACTLPSVLKILRSRTIRRKLNTQRGREK